MAGWNDELTSFHEESAGDKHFIDCASRQYTISQLNRYLNIDKCSATNKSTIMDVGCSSGYLLEQISREMPEANLIGADIVYSPLINLAEKYPHIPMFRFDLPHCPLPNDCLDAVTLINVLEHIEDDDLALKQVFRILKPGGLVVIEVPAGPHLYDFYDKELLHFRRYSLISLSEKAEQIGFTILKKSHLGFFVYPGFWLVKKKNQFFMDEAQELHQQIIEKNICETGSSKLLHQLMRFELTLGNLLRYPTGIRCLLTCKKPLYIR